jgi:hyperosmotically inducible periplasmic protein
MRKVAVLAGLLLTLSTGIALAKDAPKADNSAQNKGSTRSDSVTADKQGNRKSDVEALAEVRKTIVGTDGLSMDAKNAKILFSKGRVTLKGPVTSEDEKAKLEELAKGCAGVTSVKNMLTIARKSK